MGGVEERGFLRGSDRTGQECAAGSAPRPACLAAVPRGALSAPPAMPHFTVVPVEDKPRAEYDSVEGLSWVDYREPAAAPAPGDSYDTVSSDGERARPGGGRRCPAPGARASPAPRPAVPGRGADKGGGAGCCHLLGAPRPGEEPPAAPGGGGSAAATAGMRSPALPPVSARRAGQGGAAGDALAAGFPGASPGFPPPPEALGDSPGAAGPGLARV